jgi:hypothetical protein
MHAYGNFKVHIKEMKIYMQRNQLILFFILVLYSSATVEACENFIPLKVIFRDHINYTLHHRTITFLIISPFSTTKTYNLFQYIHWKTFLKTDVFIMGHYKDN